MKHLRFRDRIRNLALTLRNALMQDCPPELSTCEVCGELNCNSNKWVNCEKRLLAHKFMRTGDRQALAHLKELYQGADGSCAQPPARVGRMIRADSATEIRRLRPDLLS